MGPCGRSTTPPPRRWWRPCARATSGWRPSRCTGWDPAWAGRRARWPSPSRPRPLTARSSTSPPRITLVAAGGGGAAARDRAGGAADAPLRWSQLAEFRRDRKFVRFLVATLPFFVLQTQMYHMLPALRGQVPGPGSDPGGLAVRGQRHPGGAGAAPGGGASSGGWAPRGRWCSARSATWWRTSGWGWPRGYLSLLVLRGARHPLRDRGGPRPPGARHRAGADRQRGRLRRAGRAGARDRPDQRTHRGQLPHRAHPAQRRLDRCSRLLGVAAAAGFRRRPDPA